MTRKSAKRILKKKRQIKKQLKHKTDQQPQKPMPPMMPPMLGFGHQQYGNPDGVMQQLRNQNQTTIDQINSMTAALRSLQAETKKNETKMSELVKQQDEAKHAYDKSKVTLDITKSKAGNMEILEMQRAHLDEQIHNLEREIENENDQNTKLGKLNELHELQNQRDAVKMDNLKLKNKIDSNDLYNELKRTKNEVAVILAENTGYLNILASDEYQNPKAYLPKVIGDKLELNKQNDLIKQAYKLAENSEKIKALIDKHADIDIGAMTTQIINRMKKQDELNDLLADEKRGYDDAIAEYEHVRDAGRKALIAATDLRLENSRLAAKVDANNRKLNNVRSDVKKQLTHLAQAQSINDINHAKLDIQKRRGDIAMENTMLEQQYALLTGEQIQTDANKKTRKSKNSKNATDNNNNNAADIIEEEEEHDDYIDILDPKAGDITNAVLSDDLSIKHKQAELQAELDKNNELHHAVAAEKMHNQTMMAERGKQDAYNNDDNDNDAAIANQVDYKITKQETINKMEEAAAKDQTRKDEILRELSDKCKYVTYSNVWKKLFGDYYPNVTSLDGKNKFDIHNDNVENIEIALTTLNEEYAKAKPDVKYAYDKFYKAYNLIDDTNSDQSKLNKIFADIKTWHDKYDPDGDIWFEELSQQPYPNYMRDMSIFETDASDLKTVTEYYNMYKDAINKNNDDDDD